MNKDNYITLIYKKLKKEISPQEQTTLEKWVAAEKENALLQQQVEENWQLSKSILPPISIDVKKDFQGFQKRMQQHKAATAPPQKAIVRPINRGRRLWAIAAAIALPLAAALWLMRPAAVVPMTLAQTTSGETKSIQLVDGTQITLNENSELKYPVTFASDQRQVHLKGEAYFEVQSDPTRPFEVQTDQVSVKVLGTIFNVRSHPAEAVVQVSVEEGKVQLSSQQTEKSVILTKGEVGSYHSKTQQLTENKVNNKNASAWKSNVLTYKNAPLQEVLADLSQQFKVSATITKKSMQNCAVTARFTNATPKKVLDYIVEIYNMELKEIDSTNYELSKGLCQ